MNDNPGLLRVAVVAAATVGTAVLVRLLLAPWLGERDPFSLLYAAVALAAWLGGYRPAILAALLGYVANGWLFVAPHASAGILSDRSVVGTLLYAVACAIIIGFGEALRREHRKAARAAEDLRRAAGARSKAEAKGLESERRFHAFMDNSPVKAFIKDAAGHYVYMNRLMRQRFEKRGRAPIGATDADLLGAADAAPLRANDEAVLRAGRTGTFEETVEAADGRHHFLSIKFPLGGGAPNGFIGGLALDITARKRAEEAVRRTSEQLRVVTRSMAASVTHCSRDLRYVWASQAYADWIGWPIDELIGRPIVDVIGGQALETLRPHFERVLGGETVHYEERVHFRGLGPRWIDATYVPVRNAEGTCDGWVAVIHDIDARKRVEEALRESEERFRALSDSVPAHVWVDDEAGRCIQVNAACVHYTGLAVDRLLGAGLNQILHPDDQVRYVIGYRAASAARTEHHAEVRLRRHDGDYRWFDVTCRPRFAGERFAGYVGLALDVTDRKRAEQDLRRRSEELQAMLEGMPAPILIAHDPHCARISGNRAATRLYGISQTDNLSQTPGSLPSVVLPHFDGEGRELAGDELPMQRAAATGQPTEYAEMQVQAPDGRRICFYGRATPLFDEAARVRGVLAAFVDITERKQFERRVQADLNAMTRLQEIGTLCAGKNADLRHCVGRILDAAIELTGADRGCIQLLDTTSRTLRFAATRRFDAPFLDFFASVQHDDATACAAAMRTLQRVLVEDVTTSPVFAGQPCLSVLLEAGVRAVQSTPLLTSAGTLIGIVSTHFSRPHRSAERELRLMDLLARQAADFLERKQVEEELLRLNAELQHNDRQKDAFVATLAHELRNPLAPIRNAVLILKSMAASDADRVAARDVIERQTAHMARLVEDLLDVSRISRNRLELRKRRVELASVVESAVETSRPLIGANAHRLEIALPPEPVFVDADAVRLAQVLANLLNNAARYSDRGGSIRLNAERSGDTVAIVVTDTGHGIDAETLPRIFDMFAQGQPHTDLGPGGLGVGLSLAKALVELHGGTIEAHSEGVGKGSRFVVRLPLAAPEPVGAPRPPDAGDAPRPAPARVLIADDLRDSAESLAALLRMMGHDVRTAHDGEEAIAATERFKPQVVLLDIGMPKRDGYDVCRFIRAQPWGSSMCLIALTGWGQEDDRRLAKAAGFDHHLVKPVELATLTRLLASAGPARAVGEPLEKTVDEDPRPSP